MTTRGFEFHGSLDGSTPVIRDFTAGVAAAHKVGDAVLIQADGYVDQVTGDIDEVTGVVMEAKAAADITAGTTKIKVALVTNHQIWRCSMDDTTTTGVIGYTKTMDLADTNTVDADDITNGSLTLYDTGTDDDGNVLGYFIFSDCTFTNA